MREIILDTETTGLDPADGHRVIEIGCVELVDQLPTGKNFHRYLQPERDVPIETQRIHGLTDEFLADKPLFAHIVDDMMEFLGDAPLVIHNAGFDLKFLNSELHRVGRPPIPFARARAIRSTNFASASASIFRPAPNMARCWTRN
jgi:DNA polymerase III subunit epsilon